MSRRLRATLPALLAGLLVSACSSAASPSPEPAGSASPVAPTATTNATTPAPTTTAPPAAATTQLLVRGDARALGQNVRLAPGPNGTVFVSVPDAAGAVLALFDGSGMARPGWPIAIEHATSCGNPMPVPDGSVRIVCDGTDLPVFDNDASDVRAFAFDDDGRPMDGWPVTLRPGPAARVVGANLVLAESQVGSDAVTIGVVSYEVWLTTIAPDGTVHRGSNVPMVETCCGASLTVGPDGSGYAVESVGEWFEAGRETSRIIAFDDDGIRDGWPVEFDGNGSSAGYGPDGRPLVAVGPFDGDTSRVVAFDPRGSSSSGNLALSVVRGIGLGDVDCGHGGPLGPIASDDGTVFVFSEIDHRVLALDSALAVKGGWPFEPDTPIVRPYYALPESEISCSSFAFPAAGPEGVLYLALQAGGATSGGSLVAVGPDGGVRPGWPVRLNRPGSEFWSVVVGTDGIAYALALEPESGDASSASVLAIAPDSAVLSITTIVEP